MHRRSETLDSAKPAAGDIGQTQDRLATAHTGKKPIRDRIVSAARGGMYNRGPRIAVRVHPWIPRYGFILSGYSGGGNSQVLLPAGDLISPDCGCRPSGYGMGLTTRQTRVSCTARRATGI